MSKKKAKKLDPKVERLLQLILEVRRARVQAVKTGVWCGATSIALGR